MRVQGRKRMRSYEIWRTAAVTMSLYSGPMERLLLLWDEIDDLVGVGRCLVSRAVMRMPPFAARMDSVAMLVLAGTLLARQSSLL
jgi:hypothetical protein